MKPGSPVCVILMTLMPLAYPTLISCKTPSECEETQNMHLFITIHGVHNVAHEFWPSEGTGLTRSGLVVATQRAWRNRAKTNDMKRDLPPRQLKLRIMYFNVLNRLWTEALDSPYRTERGSALESWTRTTVQTTRPWHADQSDSELQNTWHRLLHHSQAYAIKAHWL